jgi:hypothetical protein
MGVNVMWRTNDFLELSVSITDKIGNGVDFVKTNGIPTSPPEGTTWEGDGIELCSAFVYRKNFIDTDSSMDWKCTQSGTLKQVNKGEDNGLSVPWLTCTPLTQSISKNITKDYTLAINAAGLKVGTYTDTIFLYHNDPTRPNPQKIACQISINEPASVKDNRAAVPAQKISQGTTALLTVTPNPVQVGQNITIQYTPTGNELHGELLVFSSMGRCLYNERVNFKSVYTANRKPLLFSWVPRSGGRETCLIRMNVTCKDGSKSVYSAKVGLK